MAYDIIERWKATA